MMSNPEMIRMATESMKSMSHEDMKLAAEQLRHTKPEDIEEISEKMAKATPQDFAAMRAQADAHITYELNAAEMLKQQGNNLHGQGKFRDAAEKYLLAKSNMKRVPVSKSRKLQLACSLNLMSCYLKTEQHEECIKEGTEVLAYDGENVKALYRRGQAYKNLGKLEAAVADLDKARTISPDDKTIDEALRDANEDLHRLGGHRHVSRGPVIEEITDEEIEPVPTNCSSNLSTEYSEREREEVDKFSQIEGGSYINNPITNSECSGRIKDNSEATRFHNFISNADPEALSALNSGGMSSEMIKTASKMMSNMSTEEVQKMLELSSSLNSESFSVATTGNKGHEIGMPPNVIKMASDMIGNMSPEELKKMLEDASSMKSKDLPFMMHQASNNQISQNRPLSRMARAQSATDDLGKVESSLASPAYFPASVPNLQEQMRNQTKDPAMRQMMSSLFKNMSPEMMANMSEQFGVKLSREEAAKAQQAMSSLSQEDLDRMMRWANRIQRGIETAKKAKNWLLGRPGMIFAIFMLILAIILHRLGYIGV